MATKTTEQVTLIDNVARPISGGFQVWFVVTDDVLPKLERAAILLYQKAAQELREGEPLDAGHIGWAAKVLTRIRVAVETAAANPREAEGVTAGKSRRELKNKHQYAGNGICSIKHDGKHTCGAIRQRRPRRGSSAAAAEAAATATGDLLTRTTKGSGLESVETQAELRKMESAREARMAAKGSTNPEDSSCGP